MKRLILLCLLAISVAATTRAIPAKPGTAVVQQPDGTQLTIALHGDEYMHFNTTADGYTVVKDQRGYYVYATLRQGELQPTSFTAHDADSRTAAEERFLEATPRYLNAGLTGEAATRKTVFRQKQAEVLQMNRAAKYDYTKLRGLIILVEFNDKSFSRTDYKALMEEMVNTPNYTGYTDTDGKKVALTGSVNDYYRDNSNGLFTPQFDIVGPVKVNRSQYYPGLSDSNTDQLMKDAADAADPLVDFSQYDGDDNGYVDMIYFIFAGCGSNISGNDSRLLWPHASILTNWSYFGTRKDIVKDGKKLDRYACSTEMTNSERAPVLDGIGTICHEFSHVLGLPDFYDTDYDQSGGVADHPGDFSILASGSYLNDGKTPCGYTIFERYAMGFTTPETISAEGSYTLPCISEASAGFKVCSPSDKEYFLFENRQQQKWDKFIPTHGMVVYRVDSTNTRVWRDNTVNCNPKHMYFEILRAGGALYSTTFPGTSRVTELNFATSPAKLQTWSGDNVQLGLWNINEKDGVITFDVMDALVLKEITLPETFTVVKGLTRTLTPTLLPATATNKLTWTIDNTSVATVADGKVTGVGAGECTLTVKSDNGLAASCRIVVEVKDVADNIAAFKQFEENTVGYLKLNDALVTYVNKNDIYLRDVSGAIILSMTGLKFSAGDRINGFVCGKCNTKNNQVRFYGAGEVTNAEDLEISEHGVEVVPREVSLYNLSADDYADLLIVKHMPLVIDGALYAVAKDRRIRLYNTFGLRGLTIPSELSGKFFDVKAIYSTNAVKGEIIDELCMLASPEEGSAPEAISTVVAGAEADAPAYNLSGQRVGSDYRGLVIRNGRKTVVGR